MGWVFVIILVIIICIATQGESATKDTDRDRKDRAADDLEEYISSQSRQAELQRRIQRPTIQPYSTENIIPQIGNSNWQTSDTGTTNLGLDYSEIARSRANQVRPPDLLSPELLRILQRSNSDCSPPENTIPKVSNFEWQQPGTWSNTTRQNTRDHNTEFGWLRDFLDNRSKNKEQGNLEDPFADAKGRSGWRFERGQQRRI